MQPVASSSAPHPPAGEQPTCRRCGVPVDDFGECWTERGMVACALRMLESIIVRVTVLEAALAGQERGGERGEG